MDVFVVGGWRDWEQRRSEINIAAVRLLWTREAIKRRFAFASHRFSIRASFEVSVGASGSGGSGARHPDSYKSHGMDDRVDEVLQRHSSMGGAGSSNYN